MYFNNICFFLSLGTRGGKCVGVYLWCDCVNVVGGEVEDVLGGEGRGLDGGENRG